MGRQLLSVINYIDEKFILHSFIIKMLTVDERGMKYLLTTWELIRILETISIA